jgi:surfeit locus 1 family protein
MLFCAFALVAAALFVRLGVWQVSRLRERQARNAIVAAQQRSAPVPVAEAPRDTASAHYRPVTVDGRYDYEHELVLASRTHNGSPGVELLTPVRIAGTDSGILVNRGWVYSPDGGTVDLSRWREGDSARVTGYIELYSADAGTTTATSGPRIVRRVSRAEVSAKVPYAVAPFYVVAVGGEGANPLVAQLDGPTRATPVRREIPALDDGPHRSYAVQWFSFAAIALAGAAAVVLRERQARGQQPTTY